MTLTYRRAESEDLPAIAFADGAAFGIDYSTQHLQDLRQALDLDRFLIAEDDSAGGGDVVGIAGDFPFEMTVASGLGPVGAIAVPGVTWVSVRSTHRRQGILRNLMTRQLTGFKDAGAPAAMLWASEGSIYGRFGYGPATQERRVSIDVRRAEFANPDRVGGVRLVDTAAARAAAPAIHDRWRASVPGAISRSPAWWDQLFLDRAEHRHGRTARRYLLHSDGYMFYRMRDNDAGMSEKVCWITDYVAVTAEAHVALWQVMLNLDLTESVQTTQLPVDDPLPHLLRDSRQVRTTALEDGLWFRPLDIATLLSARRYAIEIDTVIEVADPMFGTARFHLRGGPDGAHCRPTDALADVALGVRELGSAYLGGVRLAALARAGLVAAEPTLVTRLDRAFLADRAPFAGTAF